MLETLDFMQVSSTFEQSVSRIQVNSKYPEIWRLTVITDYNHMLIFVKETLYNSGNDKNDIKYQSFRSRFSHTKRVLNWCKILCQAYSGSVNEYVLFVCAIFHDAGYAISDDETDFPHAEASVEIFNDYCSMYDVSFIPIISNYSNPIKK